MLAWARRPPVRPCRPKPPLHLAAVRQPASVKGHQLGRGMRASERDSEPSLSHRKQGQRTRSRDSALLMQARVPVPELTTRGCGRVHGRTRYVACALLPTRGSPVTAAAYRLVRGANHRGVLGRHGYRSSFGCGNDDRRAAASHHRLQAVVPDRPPCTCHLRCDAGRGTLQWAPVTTMWYLTKPAPAVATCEQGAAIDAIAATRSDIDVPTAAARRSRFEPSREQLSPSFIRFPSVGLVNALALARLHPPSSLHARVADLRL